jgi:flagellar hook-basal body complex protein FliE
MLAPLDTGSILQLRQQILAQNAALQARLAPAASPLPPNANPLAPATEAPAFGRALDTALRQVSDVQDQATAATTQFETGQTHDLASVMIARQKASIAFEATLQARNRLIGAYKDVMNMPL